MKKLLSLILSLVTVLSLLAACGASDAEETKPAADGTATSFTLVIVHGDGSEKTLNITSEETYLARALIAEGVLTDEGIETGMYFTVDGETASWEINQSYWALYVDGDYAVYGMNDTKLVAGAVYMLVYTIV